MGAATTRRREIDIERVRRAVETAESQTSAEIVVSIAPLFFGSGEAAARRAFARFGIAATRERSGVLVFVVPSRRQLVVLADDGITAFVPPSAWEHVTRQIAEAFARGDGTAGIIEGVALLADLLRPRFPHRAGDTNELPDVVRD